jgi:hypothetical protein
MLQGNGLGAVQDDPREAEAWSSADDRLGSVERHARRYLLLDIIIMDARPKNTMPPIQSRAAALTNPDDISAMLLKLNISNQGMAVLIGRCAFQKEIAGILLNPYRLKSDIP